MKQFLLFILICIFSFPVLAQDKLQNLPEVAKMDINTFVENSKVTKQTFDTDNLLDFQIQIPRNYVVKNQDVLKNVEKNDQVYGEIFAAFGPPVEDMRPYISVKSIELDRMISAKNWLVTKALEWGYTLRAIEENKDNESFEAFYIRLDGFGRTEMVRSRGFLHQNRLILVEYVLPVSLWSDSRDYQLFTIKSFEFLNDYPVNSPENMKSFNYLDNFYFEYPDSWIFRKDSEDKVNRVDFSLKTADTNNFVLAEADFTVISPRSLKDRVDQMIYPVNLPGVVKERMEKLDREGYEFDSVFEQHEYELNFEESFQTTEVYPMREKTSSVYVVEDKNPPTKEFWLTVIKSANKEGKNYVISMVAPLRQNNLYDWSIAAKAYEEMIESIR